MTYAESPAQTTLSFIPSWEQQNPQRLVAELISLSQETNRKPDSYHFEIKNGVLIDPETNRPVLEFIQKGIEYDIAEELQSWTGQTEEGLAFWISPPLSEVYPCAKVIIHRIAYTLDGEKIVLNSAILFDANLKNPEDLRKTLFTVQDSEETIFSILAWIEKISMKKISTETGHPYIKQHAGYFAEKIIRGDPACLVVQEMQQMGFLGQNSISCSTPAGTSSFSEFTLSHSDLFLASEVGKFVRNCGSCGTPINAVISRGYRCPKCGGIYEGC